MHDLTDRQREILDAIRHHWAQYGFGPTFRWLAAATGTHPNNVRGHVLRMRDAGLVTCEDRTARSVRVVEHPKNGARRPLRRLTYLPVAQGYCTSCGEYRELQFMGGGDNDDVLLCGVCADMTT